MGKELTIISPENLEVANYYLTFGNIKAVSEELGISANKVTDIISRKEVKRYIDAVYLDTGYRNRNNIAAVLDEMIASKLEEAQETGMYSKKDLADLLKLAHQMRMDELKVQQQSTSTHIGKQNNIQFNEGIPFGSGNYGKLMESILKGETLEDEAA